VITASPDGLVRDSEIRADGSLQEGWVSADTGGYWVDAPAFGGWGQFIRAFPEALDAAGLEIPQAVILDDVSDPHGTGLPADERPWQPPRPLAAGPGASRKAVHARNASHLRHHRRPLRAGYRREDQESDHRGNGRRDTADALGTTRRQRTRPGSPTATSRSPSPSRQASNPVRLSVVRFADNPEHKRVAAAKLVIRDEPAQSWEMALLPGQDQRTLTDTAFLRLRRRCGDGLFLRRLGDRGPLPGSTRGNVLGDAITSPMSDLESGTNLIAYHSGWGDGAYPTWIGRAAGGDVVCFVADMLLMPDNAAPEAG